MLKPVHNYQFYAQFATHCSSFKKIFAQLFFILEILQFLKRTIPCNIAAIEFSIELFTCGEASHRAISRFTSSSYSSHPHPLSNNDHMEQSNHFTFLSEGD